MSEQLTELIDDYEKQIHDKEYTNRMRQNQNERQESIVQETLQM